MKRCLFALLWLLLTTGTLPAAPKNVVLFVTDDQGQDAGCYGNNVLQTPHLDRLAADGALFKYAYCTTASCSASRSVILSGIHNHANAHYGHQHSYHHFAAYDNIKTLPVLMGQAGYRTARIGKYHVAPEKVYQFDTELKSADGNRNPVAMADNCRNFIHDKSDKPFFLYFCTSDPHRGGGVVADSAEKPDRFGNKPGGYDGVKEVIYNPKDVIVPPFLPDTAACRAELAQYYQAVSRIDQGLGRLVQILKDAGRYDDTLIIYLSDHGIAMQGAKTTTYDPGLRAPLVVRNPYEKTRGIVNTAMISWVDLTPTILDFAGSMDKNAKLFHGRSFLPVVGTARPTGWDEIFASHTFHEITMYYPVRVVQGRKYKLSWNIAHPLTYPSSSDLWESATWQDVWKQGKGKDSLYGKRTVQAYLHRPKFELYDLENDPDEIKNLADDPKHAKVMEELTAKIKDFQKRTKDPWILKWEYE